MRFTSQVLHSITYFWDIKRRETFMGRCGTAAPIWFASWSLWTRRYATSAVCLRCTWPQKCHTRRRYERCSTCSTAVAEQERLTNIACTTSTTWTAPETARCTSAASRETPTKSEWCCSLVPISRNAAENPTRFYTGSSGFVVGLSSLTL